MLTGGHVRDWNTICSPMSLRLRRAKKKTECANVSWGRGKGTPIPGQAYMR